MKQTHEIIQVSHFTRLNETTSLQHCKWLTVELKVDVLVLNLLLCIYIEIKNLLPKNRDKMAFDAFKGT